MGSLAGKIAIVTGSTSGIGETIALTFAAEGAKVIVNGTNKDRGNNVTQRITAEGGEAFFIQADLSLPAEHERLVAETVKRYGRLDIAVNNAGINTPLANIVDFTIGNWDKIIGINLSGVFYGMHYQIPALLEAGGGSIINISSIFGQTARKFAAGYVASKHGVTGLTKAAALEYADQKIRINCVSPGYILTSKYKENLTKEQISILESQTPLGRLGETAEIAALVSWLASDDASAITGSDFVADGGYLAK